MNVVRNVGVVSDMTGDGRIEIGCTGRIGGVYPASPRAQQRTFVGCSVSQIIEWRLGADCAGFGGLQGRSLGSRIGE